MNGGKYDRDIELPAEHGPFLPRPEFFAALSALSFETSHILRYYAAEQFLLMMQGSAIKSEAAAHAVELVDHILADHDAEPGTEVITASRAASHGQRDIFGDDGETTQLVLEIVSLPRPLDRAAAMTAIALHFANQGEIEEPHMGHLKRFILKAKGERFIRNVR